MGVRRLKEKVKEYSYNVIQSSDIQLVEWANGNIFTDTHIRTELRFARGKPVT